MHKSHANILAFNVPIIRLCTALCGPLLLTGCDPLSVTLLGVGASAEASHQMSGLTYRTFTAPLPKIRKASLVALKNMGIKVESTEKTDSGELIKAKAADRSIEVELDALTPSITRMRTVARQNILRVDSATAAEIIAQTEKALQRS